MKLLITGKGNAANLGRMLRYYGIDVTTLYPVPKIPFIHKKIIRNRVDISLVMGIWRWHWIIRTQMLPGKKIYRVQGSDAYNIKPETKALLKMIHSLGTPILYAGNNLKDIIGLSGTVIPTPIDTKIFKQIEEVERTKDVLYYCPSNKGHIYRIDKLLEYKKNHPNETITIVDGNIPHEKMPIIYNQHKKFIRWTIHDANPKMPYEALLCGCMVWHNDQPISAVPDYMRMENGIPRFISFFKKLLNNDLKNY